MTAIDDYLAAVPTDQRQLLENVRREIRALLPDAEETISYGLPCFKVGGKAVGGFAANKNNCSYYPFSGGVLAELKDALEGFSQTKSALHFTDTQPLTPELIRLLIETRQREIATKGR